MVIVAVDKTMARAADTILVAEKLVVVTSVVEVTSMKYKEKGFNKVTSMKSKPPE